jgi:hypothetical protein
MLKANVGLSRKLSKDYNSTGFSLNLEGEINAALDDPEAVIERVRELYDLADEALKRQIDAHQSDSAIAARDVEPEPESSNGRSNGYANGHSNGHQTNGSSNAHSAPRNAQQNGKPTGEPASNKQVQFLQTLAKREKLFGQKLEGLIEEITGRRCTPYDLTKSEAGQMIEHLNGEGASNDRTRR